MVLASLDDNPTPDRRCDDIRPGLPRSEHGEPVVRDRAEHRGTVILQILHRTILAARNNFDNPN
jgi:hypothetical protein